MKAQIFNTVWHIRNLSPKTQKGYAKQLRILAIKVNLNNPLETEAYILNLNCKNKYKNHLLSAYQHFCEANRIKWQKPKTLAVQSFPVRIPTEERINMIISSATLKYAISTTLANMGLDLMR